MATTKSEQINELATALSKAQGELTDAKKGSTNPAFKSKYADLSSVLEEIRPVFSKHGLSIVQCPGFDDGKVSLETIIMHTSGQYVASTLHIPIGKQDAQGIGGAITYARRYMASAMAALAQEDDDGNTASQGGFSPGGRKDVQPAPARQGGEYTRQQFGKPPHQPEPAPAQAHSAPPVGRGTGDPDGLQKLTAAWDAMETILKVDMGKTVSHARDLIKTARDRFRAEIAAEHPKATESERIALMTEKVLHETAMYKGGGETDAPMPDEDPLPGFDAHDA